MVCPDPSWGLPPLPPLFQKAAIAEQRNLIEMRLETMNEQKDYKIAEKLREKEEELVRERCESVLQ